MTRRSGSGAALSVQAPAKINLFLHVGERRADGCHDLESLAVFAEAGDRLRIAPADALTLAMSGPFGGALKDAETNLVLRAARALAVAGGAHLTLEKNLPVASGIGGGSADAAAALRGLNEWWGLGLGESSLLRIAAEIGSDVPACVLSRPLWMTGRGEEVAVLAPMPGFALVLANPGVAVPTAQVFARLNARSGLGVLSPPTEPIRTVWDLVEYLDDAGNDLEAPAASIAPVIEQVLDALAHEPGCVMAQMSGSGATCFGLFQDSALAEGGAGRLAQDHPDWWVRVTRIAPPGIGVPASDQ